jgi:hypothetical protein
MKKRMVLSWFFSDSLILKLLSGLVLGSGTTKILLLVGLWWWVPEKYYLPVLFWGQGFEKMEPAIYIPNYNRSDYRKRTNAASKKRPTQDIRVIFKTASKRKICLFLIGQQ